MGRREVAQLACSWDCCPLIPAQLFPSRAPKEEEGGGERQRASRAAGGRGRVSRWERLPPQHSPELNPRGASAGGEPGHANQPHCCAAFSSPVPGVPAHFFLSKESGIWNLAPANKSPQPHRGRGAWKWDLHRFLGVQVEGWVSAEGEIDHTPKSDSPSILHCVETTLELPELSYVLTSRAFVNGKKKKKKEGVGGCGEQQTNEINPARMEAT